MSLCDICKKKKTLIDRIKKSNSAERAVEIFIDFCEKQLRENLNIQYAIRTKSEYESGEYGYVKLANLADSINFEDLFLDENKLIDKEIEKYFNNK